MIMSEAMHSAEENSVGASGSGGARTILVKSEKENELGGSSKRLGAVASEVAVARSSSSD